MPILNCSAESCIYNADHMCGKDTIQVDGRTAGKADETCCAAFRENVDGRAANNGREASPMADIRCEAETCGYNSQCRCHAASVSISGKDACCSGDTRCSTFRCR